MPRVIGLMSGTSLDGVDAACLQTDGERIQRFGRALTLPYEPALRAALRRLIDRAPTLPADDPDLLDATEGRAMLLITHRPRHRAGGSECVAGQPEAVPRPHCFRFCTKPIARIRRLVAAVR